MLNPSYGDAVLCVGKVLSSSQNRHSIFCGRDDVVVFPVVLAL